MPGLDIDRDEKAADTLRMSGAIEFLLNGKPVQTVCRPDTMVLEWLRDAAGLRGTKEGCAEGDCGACSVLLRRPGEAATFHAANSCILLMGQIEGGHLVTVEGLAASGKDGHAVQQRMAQNGSSQCGFCTPGIVVSLAGLLATGDRPSDDDIHDALAGNLCRCTGYRPIVEAAHQAAGDNSWPVPTVPTVEKGSPRGAVGPSDCRFHLPTTLDELLEVLEDNPEAILLAGGTDIALDVAHARARWPVVVCTRDVAELSRVTVEDDRLSLGGAVSWQKALPLFETRWPSLATLVRRFGSTQIRSMGTVAGNLATASPIGDGAPSLLALDANVVLVSRSGERRVSLDAFFTGYRKNALMPREIIRAVEIPAPAPGQFFRTYKVSKRYDQDISTVCGAFALTVDKDGHVSKARIAYGGMADRPLRCHEAEAALTGIGLDEGVLDEKAIERARQHVLEAFSPLSDMRGSARYRLMVAANLLDRLRHELAGETVEVMAL